MTALESAFRSRARSSKCVAIRPTRKGHNHQSRPARAGVGKKQATSRNEAPFALRSVAGPLRGRASAGGFRCPPLAGRKHCSTAFPCRTRAKATRRNHSGSVLATHFFGQATPTRQRFACFQFPVSISAARLPVAPDTLGKRPLRDLQGFAIIPLCTIEIAKACSASAERQIFYGIVLARAAGPIFKASGKSDRGEVVLEIGAKPRKGSDARSRSGIPSSMDSSAVGPSKHSRLATQIVAESVVGPPAGIKNLRRYASLTSARMSHHPAAAEFRKNL